MDPFSLSLGSLGLGVGSSILGSVFGMNQAGAQSDETSESIRRFMRYRNKTMSTADASAGASGITPDSASLTKYMADMSNEFTKQIDWMKESGDRRSDSTEFSTLFDSLSNFGGAATRFGKMNNWFQSPTI